MCHRLCHCIWIHCLDAFRLENCWNLTQVHLVIYASFVLQRRKTEVVKRQDGSNLHVLNFFASLSAFGFLFLFHYRYFALALKCIRRIYIVWFCGRNRDNCVDFVFMCFQHLVCGCVSFKRLWLNRRFSQPNWLLAIAFLVLFINIGEQKVAEEIVWIRQICFVDSRCLWHWTWRNMNWSI